MANAVKVKGSNTINDNDVSNGEIDNFIESFAVQRENSLNYHSSPLVTNNCSGEVVQFDGDIYEVSENHRDIIPNDESELIITLNSTRGKKRKRTTKSFGKFCGNSLTIGGRISSTINFQMALELFKKFQIDSNLKNHIESNVNQTITIFENYSNNFTGENCGNKNSQHFNLVEWLNNDPSNQIKYPLLFNYGGIEFGGGYINNDKFLESRSIVSFGSNFDKNFAMERLVESNITMSNHILQTNNVLVQALAQANKDLKEANKDLKEAMMEANKNLKDANDKLYNLAMSCKQGQNRPQPANFDFGNQANEQQFADNLFGNLQQPNRDGVQQVFVEQQQNPVAGQQVGQQQQNLHGFGQPRY